MEAQQKKKEERRENEVKRGGDNEKEEEKEQDKVPMMVLNHVSRLCRSVDKSKEFYMKVLGFVEMERPQAFDFDGAWLFNYGIGLHLVQSKDENRLPSDKDGLDPMDNHISFQCEDMEAMEKRLKEHGVKYMKRTVGDEEHDTSIDQLFFDDPDGFMVEICNCENIKLIPADSRKKIKLPGDRHNPPVELDNGRKSHEQT